MNIHQYLPHRPPMQMVDTVINISNTQVVTEFLIKPSCIFTENNLLAEIGLIENMAQTCSAIVGQFLVSENNNNKLIGYLSTIKEAQIFSLPSIQQTVRTEAQLLSRLDTDAYYLCALQCQSFCNHTLLATAQMNLVISIYQK